MLKKILWAFWLVLVWFVVFSSVLICTSCGQDRRDRAEDCFNGCPKEEAQPEVILVPMPGRDGESCTVERVDGGSKIKCGDSQAFVADGGKGETGDKGSQGDRGDTGASGRDGIDGRRGDDGTPGTPGTVVRTVTLCGSTSPHAEVAIKIGDSWVAYFQDAGGTNERLTVLIPGVHYASTDGFQTCQFTVDDLNARLN